MTEKEFFSHFWPRIRIEERYEIYEILNECSPNIKQIFRDNMDKFIIECWRTYNSMNPESRNIRFR